MKNVLVVSGHTDLNDSVANKTIMEELAKLIPSVEFDYLDKLYPDYKIDIAAEQAKLEKADVVVLQFPVFWYSLRRSSSAGWKRRSSMAGHMDEQVIN